MKSMPESVSVTLSEEDMDHVMQLVERRLQTPVVKVELVHSFETSEGHEIDEYSHVRDYPPELRFPGIVPGQTTEMRGWPCPNCGSVDTSCWGVTTVAGSAGFECRSCGAKGRWSIYCRLRPTPVHLDAECDCPDPDWDDVAQTVPETS